jgi:hypothetical protein
MVETRRGPVEVQLKSKTDDHPRYAVFKDGKLLGEVWSYDGRINSRIKGTRLIKEGKLRKLWAYRRADGQHGMFRAQSFYGENSRIDCITALVPFYKI